MDLLEPSSSTIRPFSMPWTCASCFASFQPLNGQPPHLSGNGRFSMPLLPVLTRAVRILGKSYRSTPPRLEAQGPDAAGKIVAAMDVLGNAGRCPTPPWGCWGCKYQHVVLSDPCAVKRARVYPSSQDRHGLYLVKHTYKLQLYLVRKIRIKTQARLLEKEVSRRLIGQVWFFIWVLKEKLAG
jgi:hypothetical protein